MQNVQVYFTSTMLLKQATIRMNCLYSEFCGSTDHHHFSNLSSDPAENKSAPHAPFPPKGSLVSTPAEEAARSSLLLISQLIAAYSSATWRSSVIRKLSKRMSSDMDHSSRPRAPCQENKYSEKESKFSSLAKQAYPTIKQTIKYNEKESKFSSLAKQACPNKVT